MLKAETFAGSGAQSLFQRMDAARVGLIGDLCLDMYWRADMRLSELSRETPHFPLPVVEERLSPGGAGNVAANAAALRPAALKVLGVVGTDWRGEALMGALGACGIDTDDVLRDGRVCTNTYIKPLRSGLSHVVYEDPRIDFENRAPLPEDLQARLVKALDRVAGEVDVLLVSDQMRFGCVTPAVRERICELGEAGLRVIVDSRDRVGLYRHVIVKPNEVEAARAFGGEAALTAEAMGDLAVRAARYTARPAIVTGGALGCFVATEAGVTHVPGIPAPPPIDIVGAGDTFLSALGCALAAGAPPEQAAAFANAASSVTIRKIGTTGTATREEIVKLTEAVTGQA